MSYTPIVGVFLNWPPVLHNLLASMWLFGVMPPKVKDYQQMLLPVVEDFAKYAPGPDGEDLRVYDADTEEERDNRVVCAEIMNDIRGLPCGTCGAHPPAYVGSCNICKQGGRWKLNRIVLGGAVRGVGTGIIRTLITACPLIIACRLFITYHPIITYHLIIVSHPCSGVEGMELREAFKKEFSADATLQDWAKKHAPPKRTKISSLKAGRRVASGQSMMENEAYRDEDIFSLLLWYHDKNKHVLYDNAHQFANVLKQMMNAIKNRTKKDKLNFSQNIRAKELAEGNTVRLTDSVLLFFLPKIVQRARRVFNCRYVDMFTRSFLRLAQRPRAWQETQERRTNVPDAAVGNREEPDTHNGGHHPLPEDAVVVAARPQILHRHGLHEDVRGTPVRR